MNKARICVPVCARTAVELRRDVERAAHLADIIELRFDCLEAAELDGALEHLRTLLKSTERTFIITFRPVEQGGRRHFDPAERESFWRKVGTLLEPNTHEGSGGARHFVDLEYDGGLTYANIVNSNGAFDVICSQHDFAGLPSNLEELYERMAATGAPILKIVVTAKDTTDCLTVFHLLERARREGRELIALAMDDAGIVSRVFGPARGAFLTYGALDSASRTAPGQVSAAELRDLYRVEAINEETLITGLVGSPVAHSLSPHMHNAAFTALGLNAVYLPFEVRDVLEFMHRMIDPRTREISWNLRGLSVTAPHKSAVIGRLDWVEPKALEIGAVNTVVVEGDELRGYNTDADAALLPLKDLIELRGARAAIIGAGGAARAVLWGLRERGAQTTVFARDIERARSLARQFGADVASLENAPFDNFDVVINATPLGTRGRSDNETPATAAQLRGTRVVYDLVYNPPVTRFMREARKAGCKTVGGLAMLVAQAAAQFKLWTGCDAPSELMREAVSVKLKEAGAEEAFTDL